MVANNTIDDMIEKAVFDPDKQVRESQQQNIKDMASSQGIHPASIQGLYEAAGQGHYSHKTVPAINIRGMTYDVARAVFRMALKHNAGAFIFELARTEMVYTSQPAEEYATSVLAAALKEGYTGPVFIQGDHFQLNRSRYRAVPKGETDSVEKSAREAIIAGFLNIDIDASTLVDLDKPDLDEQQRDNYLVTADTTRFIRSIQPEDVTVSVGGEIGEVGKSNTTVAELRAFMKGYTARLGKNLKGISKMSLQTGTTHGGVVLPNGSIADVKLDFNTIKELSRVAKQEFGVGGIVQHGASTLPDEMFELFPESDTLEIHLATGFQNIIYDHPSFPEELLASIYGYLKDNHSNEKQPSDTEEQFLYKTRKKAWGPFKEQTWHLPGEIRLEIMGALENQFSHLFRSLNVTDTRELVSKYV
ncbi:MAG: class II fructose-bisphosphate aldolase [Dehalococcoidales bacterium]